MYALFLPSIFPQPRITKAGGFLGLLRPEFVPRMLRETSSVLTSPVRTSIEIVFEKIHSCSLLVDFHPDLGPKRSSRKTRISFITDMSSMPTTTANPMASVNHSLAAFVKL